VSDVIGVERLAAIHSQHTESGHRSYEVDYPHWVPATVIRDAAALSVGEAFALLPECLWTDGQSRHDTA
jgi:hypothetical protein